MDPGVDRGVKEHLAAPWCLLILYVGTRSPWPRMCRQMQVRFAKRLTLLVNRANQDRTGARKKTSAVGFVFLGRLQVNTSPQAVRPVNQIRFRAPGAASARVYRASMGKIVQRGAQYHPVGMDAAPRMETACVMTVLLGMNAP